VEGVGQYSGPTPEDMRLLDLTTGLDRRLAGQPDPAFYAVEGQPDNVIARSGATWSPDGAQLAWTEFQFSDMETITLAVYDLAAGAAVSLPLALPSQYGVPGPIQVVWTRSGLALHSYRYDPAIGDGVTEIYVYAPDGRLLSIAPLSAALPDEFSPEELFAEMAVAYQGRDYFAVYDAHASLWRLVDMLNGQGFRTTAWPELVSANHPAESLRVALRELVAYDAQLNGPGERFFRAQLLGADGQALAPPYDFGFPDWPEGDRAALSPDGTAVALRVYDQTTRVYSTAIRIIRDGVETLVPEGDGRYRGMVWGAQEWRFPDDALVAPLDLAASFVCPDALPPRLLIGATAVVLPGSPNRLRDAPTLSGAVIGEIPPGEQFFVTDGPVCADGIVWWRVYYADLSGWTAEGLDEYFVEFTGVG
jgi:hypothetical protein